MNNKKRGFSHHYNLTWLMMQALRNLDNLRLPQCNSVYFLMTLLQWKGEGVTQTVFKPFKHFNKKEITVCHP